MSRASVLLPLVLAAAVSVGAVAGTRDLFSADLFRRTNFRGRSMPAGVGALVPVAALLAAVLIDLVCRMRGGEGDSTARFFAVLVAAGFSLLGLLDDVAGSAPDSSRGFRGHLGALFRGQVTTGAVKLIGGGALALAVAGMLHPTGWAAWLVDAAVIALAANVCNLFDRAPGRCTKVAVVGFVALVAAARAGTSLLGVAAVIGAGLGTFWADLRERLMLGDAGANALGAALGVGAVMSFGLRVNVALLVALVALNALSEVMSFSKLIDAVPPLRWADQLGRVHD